MSANINIVILSVEKLLNSIWGYANVTEIIILDNHITCGTSEKALVYLFEGLKQL